MACKGKKKGPKKRIVALIVICLAALGVVNSASLSGPVGLWANDASIIRLDTIAASTKYGDAVPLAGGTNWFLVTKSNDTSAAGFASDSINFKSGYQPFSLVMNSLGKIDTIFGTAVTVDTLTLARADTLSITGYAVRRTAFTPTQDQFFRLFVTTVAGQKKTTPQKAVLEVHRTYGTFSKVR